MAKAAKDLCAAVQAVFFFSFRLVTHAKKFLKNRDKCSTLPKNNMEHKRDELFLVQTISQ
jgi:hypothetical protein